ncbi:MAG: hypothetical protein CO094_08455 [Anaerolineae bacterium CG_4_9_14_3_um_filter_57_17]|nr:hypothetical protein [bacterium]NCT21906.1 hypothetical protein [bacterium]OIO84663.1 MAG: hypothetical protein AUK01_08670 [Anaerolineae bacterium CG2_30_57_67]PJB65946.1 MAG: hypothetical protein CO094_08455 [Anaerolineae bacterium CG_4_9_14_3_um_filter_57_17]
MKFFRSYPVWLALTAALGGLTYILSAAYIYRPGFPLDDAWIHLTYARNLALLGEWSFLPGQPSAGSTSPLWTLLLAPGFWLKLAPYFWPYFLGTLCFFLLAWRVEFSLRALEPTYQPRLPWGGFLLLGEWHLAWAASSGMEVLLHALLVTAALTMILLNDRRFFLLGALAGLSVWVRPDGVTLLGPLVLWVIFPSRFHIQPSTVNHQLSTFDLRPLTALLSGFLLFFLPYLAFNHALAGSLWPNTFYAKQAEYAAWQTKPFYEKAGQFFVQFLPGLTAFLAPGIFLLPWRERRWALALALIWVAGYIGLYVSRLPVYQYGRYTMPVLPILILLGLWGFFRWRAGVHTRIGRQLRLAWSASLLLVTILFWGLGARTFAADVAFIESEMVQTARWSAKNVPPGALIAAHDIGALGFFDGRHAILDLAGLISPEVIPFINDETRLARFLAEKGAGYVVAFPNWYPGLVRDCFSIYQSDGAFAGASPLGKMNIYQCSSANRKP